MKRRLGLTVVLIVALLLSSAHCPQPLIKRMTADLKVRKLSGGKKIEYNAQFCYSANGDLVAHYLPPLEYYILSNARGQIKVYKPQTNTVYAVDDAYLGSSSSYFYCFVNYRTADLGLKDWGFTLRGSRIEEGHQISEWAPPAQASARIGKIELVHLNNRIIFAAYYDAKMNLFKKTYYGPTERIKGIDFPTTLTEIIYTDPSRKDSTIEKSNFSNFAVNEQVQPQLCTYQIPKDAKVISSNSK
jgi:hypothetical protein